MTRAGGSPAAYYAAVERFCGCWVKAWFDAIAAAPEAGVEVDDGADMSAAALTRLAFSASMRSLSALVTRGFRGAPVPRARPRPRPAVVGVPPATGSFFSASDACVVPAPPPPLPRPLPLPRPPRDEAVVDSTRAFSPSGTSGPE